MRLDDTLVVFDWNGTIMCDLRRAVGATNAVLTARGLASLSARQFQDGFALPLAGWLDGLGIADAGRAEDEWNAALAEAPAAPRAEAAAVLTELVRRGALTGVVSAAGPAAVEADVAAAGLAGLLGSVTGGVDDKAAHLAGLRGLRRRAVYVGDTEYDVVSALRAGFEAVAVTGGYRPAAALRGTGADAVIDSLGGLLVVLDRAGGRGPR
ncbi:MAG: HAD hydrolase-like protein [Pseudonocardiales bacterium]|nr:HAD hydrolase-like protein [Pseudonocardiales bacterium]